VINELLTLSPSEMSMLIMMSKINFIKNIKLIDKFIL